MNLPVPDSPERTPGFPPPADRSDQNQSVSVKPVGIALARKTAAAETAINVAGSASKRPLSSTRIRAHPATAADASGSEASSPAVIDGSLPVRRPRSSFAARFVTGISRPWVAAPALILSVALLSWNLVVRLPSRVLVVQARPPTPAIDQVPTREQVDRLANQAGAAAKVVVTQSTELPRLISALEQGARAAGFAVELTTQAPTSPVPGIPELARHSVILQLTDLPENEGPTFPRFLGWLHTASTQRFKIEPGAVTLQAPGDGLSSATIELGVFSLLTDAKAAAK